MALAFTFHACALVSKSLMEETSPSTDKVPTITHGTEVGVSRKRYGGDYI